MKAHMKNAAPNKPIDVPADSPEGTMDRFAAGLQKVLSATKRTTMPTRKHRKKRR